MDGTLVDTEPYWIAAEHALVAEAGGEWDQELGLQLVGMSLWDSAEFIRVHSPVALEPAQIIQALLERVTGAVRAQGVPWRPGARELLDLVAAAGIPSALVTMSWTTLVEPVIETLPAGTFAALVTGDVVTHGKPHPEPYLQAARALGVDPAEALAIEDSPTGVTSAVRAGVPTLAVPHIVEIPAMRGALSVPSLTGLTIEDLTRLRNEAAATIG